LAFYFPPRTAASIFKKALHTEMKFVEMKDNIFFLQRTDWLIIYCFTSCSRIFHLYGDFTITGDGHQTVAYDRRSGPLNREGSLSWHGASVFPVSSEGLFHSFASYDTKGCGGWLSEFGVWNIICVLSFFFVCLFVCLFVYLVWFLLLLLLLLTV
jgi:hypothetical protein